MKKRSNNNGAGLVIISAFFTIMLLIGLVVTIISGIISTITDAEAKTFPINTEITTEYPQCFSGGVQLAERVYFFYTDTEEGLNALEDFSEHREGNIVLTLDNGRVLNKNGDGILDNEYYIHYSDEEGKPLSYTNGSRMQSIAVYNPDSDIHDDILDIYHVCLDDTTKNSWAKLPVYDDTIN